MSRTSTISSCSASKTVLSMSSGRCRRPANCSAYIRATRAGVSARPSRSGSSPMASRISRTAFSIRAWSTSGGRSLLIARWRRAGQLAGPPVRVVAQGRAGAVPVAGHGRAVGPIVGGGGQGQLLGGQDRGPVRREPLAVAGVAAAQRPLLHGGEDLEDLLPGQGLLVQQLEDQVVED